MSGYYNDADEGQRRRAGKGGRPVYQEKEEIIEKRSGGPKNRQTDLIRRLSNSDDSDDGYGRPYPPPGDAGYMKRRTRRREYKTGGNGHRRGKSADYYSSDDSYDPRPKGGKRGGDRRDRYDSDSDSYSDDPPRRKGERRKSIVEQALAAAGIGGVAAKALGVGKDRDRDDRSGRPRSRSRGGSRRGSQSRSRSQSRSTTDVRQKMLQAGKAAAMAGVAEAWRSRKEPGGMGGNVKRIATAAIGAAGIDSALDRDPEHHGTRHAIESAIGGIMGNRLVNGRRESRSRSRSRSKSRGGRSQSSGPGLGALASAAGIATLGAKAYKNYRNRSKDRGSGSDGSSDGGRSSRGKDLKSGLRARSRSVQRFVNAGLAKIGLDDPRKTAELERRDRRGGYSDDDDSYAPRPRGGELTTQNKINDRGEKKKEGTSTDSYSSTDEEKKQRKMRGKEMLTAGLATVATIHAVHTVYSSYGKRKERRKEVEDGTMDPETAKKLRNRARVKDAASVGIAAIGIKHAFNEWKEMKEQYHEYHEKEKRLAEMREHRRAKRLQQQQGQGQGGGDGGPQYNQGGNPYATSVPPPPMGQSQRY